MVQSTFKHIIATRQTAPRRKTLFYFFLKNCTSCSCFCAAARVLKVPRFLLLPVFGFFLREYKRYCPDFSFLIMSLPPLMKPRIEILLTFRGPPQHSKQSA